MQTIHKHTVYNINTLWVQHNSCVVLLLNFDSWHSVIMETFTFSVVVYLGNTWLSQCRKDGVSCFYSSDLESRLCVTSVLVPDLLCVSLFIAWCGHVFVWKSAATFWLCHWKRPSVNVLADKDNGLGTFPLCVTETSSLYQRFDVKENIDRRELWDYFNFNTGTCSLTPIVLPCATATVK